MKPSLILINPWIYDFAAYDLWSKPLGLLYLAGYLRSFGYKIHLIDCLDIHHPDMLSDPSRKPPKRRAFGTGKFWRQQIPKPLCLEHVPRPYSRYGLFPTIFVEELRKCREPAAILVTSLMTYWYPGVQEVVRLAKEVHPGVPVILGGTYATLCREHALKHTGADYVLTDRDPSSLLKVLESHGFPASQAPHDLKGIPYTAFDLFRQVDYVCLQTSTGCPYRCPYCASHFLCPDFTRRNTEEILDEILYWHRDFGVRDFAFYDDALLVASESHLGVVLEALVKLEKNLRFHTPNAVHVSEMDRDLAKLMRKAGFMTIRLGLETSDYTLHRELGNKVKEGEFDRSVRNLLSAGFLHQEIGAYVLTGLPGQSVHSVMETIEFVGLTGAIPFISEYSPIPHTGLWEKAVRTSQYDIASEPLFHNNVLLPCWEERDRKELSRLKKKVLEIREKYR